jgi:hypothetical protein
MNKNTVIAVLVMACAAVLPYISIRLFRWHIDTGSTAGKVNRNDLRVSRLCTLSATGAGALLAVVNYLLQNQDKLFDLKTLVPLLITGALTGLSVYLAQLHSGHKDHTPKPEKPQNHSTRNRKPPKRPN